MTVRNHVLVGNLLIGSELENWGKVLNLSVVKNSVSVFGLLLYQQVSHCETTSFWDLSFN